MRIHGLRQTGWLAGLVFAFCLTVSTPTRADPLDSVLDVLYKAGVIDGNVKAAKPLISCLVNGSNAVSCAGGNAEQTELANDPQVKNVLNIYQSFNDHDWYGVLKKAGVTVGCALIPGGEVKDVVCGELGKIAGQVLDGVGSVLGAVGGFVSSMFGGGSDPAPMKEEDYYTLNFMPWYHWSVVHQLDNDTPANLQVLNAPMAACVDYFDNHQYSGNQAATACNNLRTRLNNTGYALGNAFRDETDSYFQLHFAPKVQAWAEISFNSNDNINSYAKQAMSSCLWDERQHIPLPSPGFEQCQALKQSLANLPPIFKSAGDQMYAQCQVDAKQRVVPTDNDAYTRICTPMKNRVIGQVILAMNDFKSLMNTAAAAGCPNNGYPKSIHCDTFAAHDACVNAMPEHASMCGLNFDKAAGDVAAGCSPWTTLSADKHSCVAFSCPPDTLAVNHACVACPSGTHSDNPFAKACYSEACPSGQGLLPGSNDCGVCPPDTQLKQGGHCEPCTQGSHSKGGNGFCSLPFPTGVNCPAGTVNPPGDNTSCVCAPGTENVGGVCQPIAPTLHAMPSGVVRTLPPPAMACPGATNVDGSCANTCPGATVANPNRPGYCMDCPNGMVPNVDHLTCVQPTPQAPTLRMRRAPIIKSGGGG